MWTEGQSGCIFKGKCISVDKALAGTDNNLCFTLMGYLEQIPAQESTHFLTF